MDTEAQASSNKGFLVAALALGFIVLLGAGYFLLRSQSAPSPANETGTTASTTDTTNATSTPSQTSGYTLAEVAAHNTQADCWMAIEGKVYDVTQFIPAHPGGKAIIGGCGKDATVLFNERPTNDRGPHPAQAKAALAQYYIGELK